MRRELRLPRPRTCALLVLAFLGFGVLLGHVAGVPVRDTLASSARPQLKLELPAVSAAAPTSTATTPSSSNTEPPASESTLTPEATTSTPARKPAAKPKPSKTEAKESSEGESKGKAGAPAPGTPDTKLPAVKHVWVIMLSGQSYAATFGPESQSSYLAHTLEAKGELLAHYDAVAHEQLANEIGLISGQGPTEETAANCANFAPIAPATPAADEQVLGNGCVYPASTETLAGQLAAKHLSWRAYIQSTDEPGSAVAACGHPALGAADPTSVPGSGAYATYKDPFVYFQSIIASPSCANDVVGLNKLRGDLASPSTTPSFSYIAPDRCHDGNPTPCAAGEPAGLAHTDIFLQDMVSEIVASKAYKESGLIVVTVDNAPSSGAFADSSSCCGQPRFPNIAADASTLTPHGGGAVGALLLSPFVKGASTSQEPFDHFSLLRTIEDFFGLKHLGYAGLPKVKSFEPAMFVAPAGKG